MCGPPNPSSALIPTLPLPHPTRPLTPNEVCVDCVADPHLYRDIGQIAASSLGSLQVLALKACAEAE